MSDIVNESLKMGAVPDGYAEVVVDFFQFNNEGDHVSGRLVGKTQTTVRGNRIGRYTLIEIPGGRRVTFLGGVDLDEKLSNVSAGAEVWIQFTHKERTKEGEFEMKRFKVFVKTQQPG